MINNNMMNPMMKNFGMGMGMNNMGMGMNNMGMGMNNIGMGMNNIGMGMNNIGMGMNNIGMGMNNMGMGMNNMGMGNNNIGMGMNNMGMGNNNMGMGMNNIGMGNNNMGMGMNNIGMGNNNIGMGMNNMGMGMSNMGMGMNNMNQNNNIDPPLRMFMIPVVNNINNVDNRIGGKAPKDLIPRTDKFRKADFYKGINQKEKLNIVIQASTGMTVLLPSPPYISIAQLFKNYVKKIGLPETVLEKSITFIFEANVVDPFDPSPISSKFKDNSLIIVIDSQNIISA